VQNFERVKSGGRHHGEVVNRPLSGKMMRFSEGEASIEGKKTIK